MAIECDFVCDQRALGEDLVEDCGGGEEQVRQDLLGESVDLKVSQVDTGIELK